MSYQITNNFSEPENTDNKNTQANQNKKTEIDKKVSEITNNINTFCIQKNSAKIIESLRQLSSSELLFHQETLDCLLQNKKILISENLQIPFSTERNCSLKQSNFIAIATEILTDKVCDYLDLFIGMGYDINGCTEGGYTALDIAFILKDQNLARQLVKRGAYLEQSSLKDLAERQGLTSFLQQLKEEKKLYETLNTILNKNRHEINHEQIIKLLNTPQANVIMERFLKTNEEELFYFLIEIRISTTLNNEINNSLNNKINRIITKILEKTKSFKTIETALKQPRRQDLFNSKESIENSYEIGIKNNRVEIINMLCNNNIYIDKNSLLSLFYIFEKIKPHLKNTENHFVLFPIIDSYLNENLYIDYPYDEDCEFSQFFHSICETYIACNKENYIPALQFNHFEDIDFRLDGMDSYLTINGKEMPGSLLSYHNIIEKMVQAILFIKKDPTIFYNNSHSEWSEKDLPKTGPVFISHSSNPKEPTFMICRYNRLDGSLTKKELVIMIPQHKCGKFDLIIKDYNTTLSEELQKIRYEEKEINKIFESKINDLVNHTTKKLEKTENCDNIKDVSFSNHIIYVENTNQIFYNTGIEEDDDEFDSCKIINIKNVKELDEFIKNTTEELYSHMQFEYFLTVVSNSDKKYSTDDIHEMMKNCPGISNKCDVQNSPLFSFLNNLKTENIKASISSISKLITWEINRLTSQTTDDIEKDSIVEDFFTKLQEIFNVEDNIILYSQMIKDNPQTDLNLDFHLIEPVWSSVLTKIVELMKNGEEYQTPLNCLKQIIDTADRISNPLNFDFIENEEYIAKLASLFSEQESFLFLILNNLNCIYKLSLWEEELINSSIDYFKYLNDEDNITFIDLDGYRHVVCEDEAEAVEKKIKLEIKLEKIKTANKIDFSFIYKENITNTELNINKICIHFDYKKEEPFSFIVLNEDSIKTETIPNEITENENNLKNEIQKIIQKNNDEITKIQTYIKEIKENVKNSFYFNSSRNIKSSFLLSNPEKIVNLENKITAQVLTSSNCVIFSSKKLGTHPFYCISDIKTQINEQKRKFILKSKWDSFLSDLKKSNHNWVMWKEEELKNKNEFAITLFENNSTKTTPFIEIRGNYDHDIARFGVFATRPFENNLHNSNADIFESSASTKFGSQVRLLCPSWTSMSLDEIKKHLNLSRENLLPSNIFIELNRDQISLLSAKNSISIEEITEGSTIDETFKKYYSLFENEVDIICKKINSEKSKNITFDKKQYSEENIRYLMSIYNNSINVFGKNKFIEFMYYLEKADDTEKEVAILYTLTSAEDCNPGKKSGISAAISCLNHSRDISYIDLDIPTLLKHFYAEFIELKKQHILERLLITSLSNFSYDHSTNLSNCVSEIFNQLGYPLPQSYKKDEYYKLILTNAIYNRGLENESDAEKKDLLNIEYIESEIQNNIKNLESFLADDILKKINSNLDLISNARSYIISKIISGKMYCELFKKLELLNKKLENKQENETKDIVKKVKDLTNEILEKIPENSDSKVIIENSNIFINRLKKLKKTLENKLSIKHDSTDNSKTIETCIKILSEFSNTLDVASNFVSHFEPIFNIVRKQEKIKEYISGIYSEEEFLSQKTYFEQGNDLNYDMIDDNENIVNEIVFLKKRSRNESEDNTPIAKRSKNIEFCSQSQKIVELREMSTFFQKNNNKINITITDFTEVLIEKGFIDPNTYLLTLEGLMFILCISEIAY
ncbi:MAG: hypothetical protein CMO81_01545 [Waddliaceae bacterium]|nr:hypothetical protein [Waddliaceae bacterium]